MALGLAQAGFRDEANRIAVAQLEAASFTGFRLPEVFAGFERGISRFPVPYPTACSPQAWATGAPFPLSRRCSGSAPATARCSSPQRSGRDRSDRHPEIHAFGTEWDVEASTAPRWSKTLRIRKTLTWRREGDDVFTIQKKLLSIRDTMEIGRDGKTVATIKKALVTRSATAFRSRSRAARTWKRSQIRVFTDALAASALLASRNG